MSMRITFAFRISIRQHKTNEFRGFIDKTRVNNREAISMEENEYYKRAWRAQAADFFLAIDERDDI